MSAYLDSSAIVKLVLDEHESDAMRSYMARAGDWSTSALARTEVICAVSAGGSRAIADARVVLSEADLIPVSTGILDAAAELTLRHPLRTLDAIHLASAGELADVVDEVVTYDHRMVSVAGDLGFVVVSP